MPDNYKFFDADASILTAGSSIVGSVHYPIVKITSVISVQQLGMVISSISGIPQASVHGTINIGVIPGSVVGFQGTSPWIISGSVQSTAVANQSVSGTVGASILGTVPVIQSGIVITSISGIPQASVHGDIKVVGNPSISGQVGASVIGTVPITGNVGQTGTRISSISGVISINPASVSGQVGASVIGTVPITQSGTVITSISGVVVVGVNPVSVMVRGNASTVGTGSVAVVVAGGAGLRNYITEVVVANTGAATGLITFTDGDASVLGKTIAPDGGGSNINGMKTPMATSANQPFNFTSNTASSVIHVTALGYRAP